MKQRFSDFDLMRHNIETIEFWDNRLKTGEINGKYVYNYSLNDSLKFRNRNYLWNWLSKIYVNELYG